MTVRRINDRDDRDEGEGAKIFFLNDNIQALEKKNDNVYGKTIPY